MDNSKIEVLIAYKLVEINERLSRVCVPDEITYRMKIETVDGAINLRRLDIENETFDEIENDIFESFKSYEALYDYIVAFNAGLEFAGL